MDEVDLDALTIAPTLLDLVPVNVAETYRVIPIREHEGLLILTTDSESPMIAEDLQFMLRHEIKLCWSTTAAIDRALAKYYTNQWPGS